MVVTRTGTTPTPFGFVGGSQYQTDTDSGLMLLGHRYYDAGTGRFISQDPIHDGTNWYAYCENNPLVRTDPSGLIERGPSDEGSDWIRPRDNNYDDPPPPPLDYPWFDFNFNRDDWREIGMGIQDWGTGEMAIGGALASPSVMGMGGTSPFQPIPGLPTQSLIPPAKPGAIMVTIGAGIAAGGGIAWLIGKVIEKANL